MRAPFYVWQDGEKIHLDDLDMPLAVFDELVVMRWAQLTEDELQATMHRAAIAHRGNFGCDALLEDLGHETAWQAILRTLPPPEGTDAHAE